MTFPSTYPDTAPSFVRVSESSPAPRDHPSLYDRPYRLQRPYPGRPLTPDTSPGPPLSRR